MSLSIVAGPRPVYWSATARTASSDTSNSSPKSPNARPSPIVRNSLPTGSRPTATVPVPAITAMPQDSDVPARSAMKASFTIRRSTPGVTAPRARSVAVRRRASPCPASPNALAAIESADARASSSAAPTADGDRGLERRPHRRSPSSRRPPHRLPARLPSSSVDHRVGLAAAPVDPQDEGHAIARRRRVRALHDVDHDAAVVSARVAAAGPSSIAPRNSCICAVYIGCVQCS